MSNYCVIKLSTGEQIIANVTSKMSDGIMVNDPINVKQIPTVSKTGEIHERVVVSRYCHYTNENVFFFRDRDVIFVKPLKSKFIKYYEDVVKDFGNNDNVQLGEEVDDSEDDPDSFIQSSNLIH